MHGLDDSRAIPKLDYYAFCTQQWRAPYPVKMSLRAKSGPTPPLQVNRLFGGVTYPGFLFARSEREKALRKYLTKLFKRCCEHD